MTAKTESKSAEWYLEFIFGRGRRSFRVIWWVLDGIWSLHCYTTKSLFRRDTSLHPYVTLFSPFGFPRVLHYPIFGPIKGCSISHDCHPMVQLCAAISSKYSLWDHPQKNSFNYIFSIFSIFFPSFFFPSNETNSFNYICLLWIYQVSLKEHARVLAEFPMSLLWIY